MHSIRTEWLYHENQGFDQLHNWGFGHGSAQRQAEGQSYALWTTTTLPVRWLNDFGQFSGSTTSSGGWYIICVSGKWIPQNPMAYGISSWSRMCQTQSWTIPNRGLWNWVSYFYSRWFEIAPTGLVTGIVWYWVYHINKTHTQQNHTKPPCRANNTSISGGFSQVFLFPWFPRIFPLVFLAIWRFPKG